MRRDWAASLAADLPVGSVRRVPLVLAAYIGPAVVTWAVAGLVLNWLPLSSAALPVIVVYALFYGILETAGRAVLPAPGSRWQAPPAGSVT